MAQLSISDTPLLVFAGSAFAAAFALLLVLKLSHINIAWSSMLLGSLLVFFFMIDMEFEQELIAFVAVVAAKALFDIFFPPEVFIGVVFHVFRANPSAARYEIDYTIEDADLDDEEAEDVHEDENDK